MKQLKKQKIWICWKYVIEDGEKKKKPCTAKGTATGVSDDYRKGWVDYETALAAYRKPSNHFDGIGFIMPDGFFLLDVDHRSIDDPLFQAIRSQFPTYTEISPSGQGYHLYGRADVSRIPQEWNESEKRWKMDGKYYVKNSNLGIELYIGGLTNRFATFTGNVLEESASESLTDPQTDASDTDTITDCTEAVLPFLETYMKKPNESGSFDELDTKLDTEKFIKLSEDQIPEILEDISSQRNGDKFRALFYDGDTSAYGSASEADAGLCALIAFRTGPNPELIDTIFRQSALYRDKWERSDYSSDTIKTGIKACRGIFHKSTKVRPSFVLIDEKTSNNANNAKIREYVHPTLLADYVRKHVQYIFVREAMRGSFQKYVYENGCYRNYSDDMFKGVIKAFVTDYDPMLLKMSIIEEAFRQLNTDINHIPQTALNADENIINFQNGLLDIRTMTLRKHDPSVISTIQIPCDWIASPSATPVFDSYLAALTGGDEDTQKLLLEFMGACLSNVPGYRMKKALFLHGPGDTGKSQLKRLVEKLLGEGNYTGIDLQQMEARFGTSSIYGKRLAGSSDMSFMTVNELKVFKKTTGGDALFAEFKGQDSFEFVYAGLLWFCMNELPKFGGDDGTWVFDRIIPVCCPNIIPADKRDHKLLDKMYAERAGIVCKAVMAFKDVIERGYRFTEAQGLKDARAEYRVENNTALEFFHTCMQPRKCPIKRDEPFTVKKVYYAYCRWYDACYGRNYHKSKKEFFRSIADSLGVRYEDMITENAKGTILRDYCPNPDVWEEYDLSDECFENVRRWVS